MVDVVAHVVPAGGAELSNDLYVASAALTVAKLPKQEDTAASFASVPMLFTVVVVVVPAATPPVGVVLGELGPFEMAIVAMTPRMTTTARVEIIPTPLSESRPEKRVARVVLRVVVRTVHRLSILDVTARSGTDLGFERVRPQRDRNDSFTVV